MAIQKTSKKAEATVANIKNAFFKIYDIKPLDKISIKEITDLAGLNRGTFYIYFKDIYDLHEKVEDEIFLEISSKIKLILPKILNGSFTEKSVADLDMSFVKDNKLPLKIMLRQGSGSRLALRVKELVKELIKSIILPLESHVDYSEYVLEYMISGQLGLISYWIEQDFKLPENEFVGMLLGINREGPLTQIKKILS